MISYVGKPDSILERSNAMVARQLVFGAVLLIVGGVYATTYNVVDFGANGSDSASDRKAIQDALDKAKGASEATVVTVPAGTYYLDRALFIYSNTRLSLSAGAKFLRSGSSDQIMLLARHLLGDGSECKGDDTCTHGGHSQFSNIIVDGGIWDAASSDQEITGVLRLSHGSKLTIENVHFQGCTDHMLNISGSSDVLVRGCTFASPVRYAGTDPKAWEPYAVGDANRFNTIECIHMDFTDEEGEEGNYPHDGTACERVTVTGCMFDGVFAGVGNHHATPGRFSPALTVQDCVFTNLQAYAVDCFGLTNCVIAQCTSVGGLGLVRSSLAQFSATSNYVESAGEHAFFLVHGTRAALTGNRVAGSTQGVNVVGADVELRGNYLSGCSDCGVRADEGSTVLARDNYVATPTGYGFSCTGASSLSAVANVVSNPGKAGFIVTGGGSVALAGNTVSSPVAVGIQLENIVGAKLLDNTITSSGSHGVWLKNCEGAVLEGNEIRGSQDGHGIILQAGTAEVLGNNILYTSKKNGILAEDDAVVTARGNCINGGQYGVCATVGVTLVAEANEVADVKGSAFYLADLNYPVVTGNAISSPGNCGVQIVQTEGASVKGNSIVTAGGRGVLMTNSTKCDVSGNVIDGTSQEGIFCLESTDANISGNIVLAAAGIGIRVEGSTTTLASASVVGNRAQSSTTHDIRICDNCGSCRLTENVCTGNAATIALSVIGSTTYLPGDVPCSAVQRDDGTIFVRWERLALVSGYENGYLLDYGNAADFSGCATVEIASRDTVSYTLTPGSAKYVRVRSYHVYYSSVRYESTGSAGFDVPVGEAKVVFDDCGGAGGPGVQSVPFGGVIPQIASLPTRGSCVFSGYWTEPMGRGVNYVRADGVGTASVESDWLPTRLYACWERLPDAVAWPDISEHPEPDPEPDPNPADIPALTPAGNPDPGTGPGTNPDPDPEGSGGGSDPEPKPETTAPQLYATADKSAFAGGVTYVGWVRDANGVLAGLLTVKLAKANKRDGTCKPKIVYTPLGGKKQAIKLDKTSLPVAGTEALLKIPGVGTLRLCGRSATGTDVDVQLGADLARLAETKAAAKARMAALAGVRTFALETEQGAAAFSVTVSKAGKGKLAGTLPDGTKVSLSAQGVLGERALAIPFSYSKKCNLGFVLWIGENGKTEVSDMTSLRLASGRVLPAKLIAPSALHRLPPGSHAFSCYLFAEPQIFSVEGAKWVFPRQDKRAVVDPNPHAAKLKFAEKTGVVKGSFSVTPPGSPSAVKFTVNGVVVGSRFYGAAFNKSYGSLSVSAE